VADVTGIGLVNQELGGLIPGLQLFAGITLFTFFPYLVYLVVIRPIANFIAGRFRMSKRLAMSIFYCLAFLPIDFLVARDWSVYSALGVNAAVQVKFFTLRIDYLLLVTGVSWIIGFAMGIFGTSIKRLPDVPKPPHRTRGVVFAVVAAVILAILYLPPFMHGPSTIGTPPSGAKLTGRPANVVLISIDTMRTDELGCYGSQGAKTPDIDKIAGESMVFDNAVTSLPMTGPSHMSMMTGLQPDRVIGHGVTSNGIPLPENIPTLATVLESAGYETGAVIGGLPLARQLSGLQRGFHYYNDIFEDRLNTVVFAGFMRSTTIFRVWQRSLRSAKIVFPYLQKSADTVTDRSIAWLGENSSKPFFLFVHYYDTHGPYDPPEPFDTMYSPADSMKQLSSPHPFIYEEWVASPPNSIDDLAKRRALYRGEVTHVDREIGRMYDWGEKRGLWDNTLLIITADHGEGFDSDYIGHINRLYEPIVKIPMIIRDPESVSTLSKVRSSRLVNVSDVFFTVLSYLKVEPPKSATDAATRSPGSIDGWDHDLIKINAEDTTPDADRYGWNYVPMLTHGAPSPKDVDIGRLFALRFPDWILIYGPDARPYYQEYTCFDLANDPDETVNAYTTWDWKAEEYLLVPEALKEWASTQGMDKSDAKVESDDPQVMESLRALGYLQ
jgi:arylsulfatase A-like enzyme